MASGTSGTIGSMCSTAIGTSTATERDAITASRRRLHP
jgi:hypothetical protein